MVKLLFVLMNEYRLWALPQALAALERRYPGAVEGRVYSVREINADAGLERALLADGAAADMAFLASHGSIQNLYCFSRLWEALEGRPVYFTSTMGDELAELLPRLGLEPALYAALDSYYQAGSPGDLEGLVLCALNGRFGGDYPLSPPSPPRGQGVYTLEGFLPPEREAGYRTRMAAETRPVIGVLIHDHYARTGNLEHVDALLRAIQARGGVPYALSDSFAADHGTEQGILYRMERFYRRADGTPIPGALVVSYGFSLTTLAGREARAGQVPASVFENWGLPVIQGLTTYFSADEYRRDIRGLDLVSLPVCVYQPEFDGQLISVPYAVTERTADGRKVCRQLSQHAAPQRHHRQRPRPGHAGDGIPGGADPGEPGPAHSLLLFQRGGDHCPHPGGGDQRQPLALPGGRAGADGGHGAGGAVSGVVRPS